MSDSDGEGMVVGRDEEVGVEVEDEVLFGGRSWRP